MKKSLCVSLLSLFFIMACATPSEVVERPPNERIVYRDLTKPMPVRYKVPRVPDVKDIPKEPANISVEAPKETGGIMPQVFVEFKNESHQLYDVEALKGFIEKADKEAHIILIGHSHGNSSVGTLRLASQRAQSIRAALAKRGFINVHVMASWGKKGVVFAPSRGVHLYVISEFKNDEGVPLIFARSTERKVEANGISFKTASVSIKSTDSGL